MNTFTIAVSNLVNGRPFTLSDESIDNYPDNIDLEGDYPEKADVLLEMKQVDLNLEKNNRFIDIRSQISNAAGDTESLLGTTTDATQFLLYGFTTLIAKLHTANSLAEMRQAAVPFADLSADFIAKIDAGEVKLPFMNKGLKSVISDIEQRATAVAKVLESATDGE